VIGTLTRKAGTWWEKNWMERHTSFLPRYDSTGPKFVATRCSL
jgi:hypothetical protein